MRSQMTRGCTFSHNSWISISAYDLNSFILLTHWHYIVHCTGRHTSLTIEHCTNEIEIGFTFSFHLYLLRPASACLRSILLFGIFKGTLKAELNTKWNRIFKIFVFVRSILFPNVWRIFVHIHVLVFRCQSRVHFQQPFAVLLKYCKKIRYLETNNISKNSKIHIIKYIRSLSFSLTTTPFPYPILSFHNVYIANICYRVRV